MKNKQSGFAPILGIIIVLVLLAGAGYLYSKKATPTPPSALPEGEGTLTTSPLGGGQEGVATDETANWKTYTNEKYGFEFKYPSDVSIVASDYPGKSGGNVVYDKWGCVFQGNGYDLSPGYNDGDLPQPLYFCVTRSKPSLPSADYSVFELKNNSGVVIFYKDRGFINSTAIGLVAKSFKTF